MGRDLRYAIRVLTASPAFALAAVATLAIGIAANTIAFTLVNAILLKPMPVPQANRVVRLYPVLDNGRRGNLWSYPDYVDYRTQAKGLEVLAAYIPSDVTVGRSSRDAGPVEPRPALAYIVSPEYFDIVGAHSSVGRVLNFSDERPSAAPAVVISYAMWRTRFEADPGVIGETLALNGRPFTVVGVGPRDFAGTEPLVADVWVPLSTQPIVDPRSARLDDREFEWLLLVGRLSDRVTSGAAADTLQVIVRRLETSYPGKRRPQSIGVAPATFFMPDPGLKSFISLVMGIVGLVLLIACANVANLMLARAAARQREIAVRLAIGAGRWRIVQQLLTESLLIGLLAGGAALLISEWTLRVLYSIGVSLAPFPWTIVLDLRPDARVFAYTFALATSAGALFGIVPALQITAPGIAAALHEDGALIGARVSRSRIRNGLVVTQIACSLVLLIAAGLLLRGLRSARALDLGFNADHVLYTEYDLEKAGYSTELAARFTADLRERVSRLPGVTVTAVTSHVPLHGGIVRTDVRLERDASHSEPINVVYTVVSPEYFDVLRIRITAGRNFTDDDLSGRTSAAMVSEGLAARFWPGQSALGRTLVLASSKTPATVVGIARDTSSGAIWREKELSIYLPAKPSGDARKLHLLLRTQSDAAAVTPAVRRIASELDPDMRFEAIPLDTLLRMWILPSRVAAAAAGVLGLIALALASIGIYGVLAYVVSQRTREIGIRMALGANAGDVVRLVIREGTGLIAVGLVIGAVAAAAGAPLLRTLLFDVSALDPAAFAVASLVLTTVGLVACYMPARRAARVEPLAALRTE